MTRSLPTPEHCPVCGASVPPRALACPSCGADHQTGWQETADHLDLPEDTFDYEAFVEREFGSPSARSQLHPAWWLTAVVLIIAFVWWLLPF